MRIFFCALALFAIAATPACSCQNNNRQHGGGGDGGAQVGSISISPTDATLDLAAPPAPPSTQAFTVIFHSADGDKDVTAQALYTLADPTLGTMVANTFNTGTDHGGSTTLVANFMQQTAQANIHVKVHGSFTTTNCVGCTFPPDGAMACGAADTNPSVVYPPDGVLLPPNMNSLDIQWLPGTGNMQFEVSFENPATDVKVYTKCAPTIDTRSAASGGCQLPLTQQMWDFIAKSNKGGDPVKVAVRGTTNNTCISPGANLVNMAFAEADVSGGIYYWKSTVSANGTGGQIWRKEFGSTMNEEQITGTGILGSSCNGCHSLSRDGQRMTINSDDDDSDDEYSDTNSSLIDVGKKMVIGGMGFASGPAGFQTFNHDHSLYIASTGDGSGSFGFGGGGNIMPNQFFIVDGNTDALATPNAVTGAMATTQRVTMPDWSADDKNMVYVVPTQVGSPNWQANDTHVLGGSLFTVPYDTAAKKFGAPVALVTSTGENNYYPSYSPDGAFIIFDRVAKQVVSAEFSKTGPNNDSFSNPKARVFILPTNMGATPIDCAALNGTGDLSNSWPRWSPFVQTYKGSKLLWVTFSSTRDYALLVRNSDPSLVQCYPPDSAEDPGGAHSQPFPPNCRQPQIWMAAINLTTAEVMNTTDPSFPAFWLPFQDISTHNHTAQWTTTVVNTPPPDGGTCLMGGEDCTHAPNNCCGTLVCTANGTCGVL